jgi:hypothetical protein
MNRSESGRVISINDAEAKAWFFIRQVWSVLGRVLKDSKIQSPSLYHRCLFGTNSRTKFHPWISRYNWHAFHLLCFEIAPRTFNWQWITRTLPVVHWNKGDTGTAMNPTRNRISERETAVLRFINTVLYPRVLNEIGQQSARDAQKPFLIVETTFGFLTYWMIPSHWLSPPPYQCPQIFHACGHGGPSWQRVGQEVLLAGRGDSLSLITILIERRGHDHQQYNNVKYDSIAFSRAVFALTVLAEPSGWLWWFSPQSPSAGNWLHCNEGALFLRRSNPIDGHGCWIATITCFDIFERNKILDGILGDSPISKIRKFKL